MAGNQLGKTYCGAAEAAMHLTGQYPDWWAGRRWDRPVRAWAGSKTGEVTRDGVQRYLIGEPKDESQWGTGMVPGDARLDWSRRPGVAMRAAARQRLALRAMIKADRNGSLKRWISSGLMKSLRWTSIWKA
jgi:hypothetical protein